MRRGIVEGEGVAGEERGGRGLGGEGGGGRRRRREEEEE